MKQFNGYDAKIITQCQWYSNSLDFELSVDLNQIKHLMRINKLAKKDVDSIFMYFEMFTEELTVF